VLTVNANRPLPTPQAVNFKRLAVDHQHAGVRVVYCGMAVRKWLCAAVSFAIMLQQLPCRPDCRVYYAILERSFIMREVCYAWPSVAYVRTLFNNIGIGAVARPIHRGFYRLRCSRCPNSNVMSPFSRNHSAIVRQQTKSMCDATARLFR